MKRTALFLSFLILTAPLAILGQSSSISSTLVAEDPNSDGGAVLAASQVRIPPPAVKPLSRVALGVGVSALGINLQATTNLNRYMNLRATGNVFKYDANNISTNGFNVDAKLNLVSVGASLDFYPFPNHGFRLSPGVLFHNTNGANATFTAQGGTSFTLDNYTYYASTTNPVEGVGTVGLHTQDPAFTITTGWGNVIPRHGGHLSFPFEVGVAFVGDPAINVALNSGQVCNAQGLYCMDVATDQDVQTNLQSQIAKYKNDLDPLKTYPIVSFGMAYNFRIRKDSLAVR